MVDIEILDIVFVFALFLLSLLTGGFDDSNNNLNEVRVDDVNDSVIKNIIQTGIVEDLDENIEVFFCSSDDCYSLFETSFLKAEEEILCAFYEFDLINLSKVLVSRYDNGIDVELIIDDKYLEEDGILFFENSSINIFSDTKRGTRYNNYMHDKFCIIYEEVLIIGSANPTSRGLFFNDNNVFKINSKYLSTNYKNEFLEMKSGNFGTNKKSSLQFNELVLVENDGEEFVVSSYMCPQDDCESEILEVLNSAKDEILFASFVLTLDSVEDILVEKSKNGIYVEGVIENRMKNSKGSLIVELNESFNITFDKNKYTMHHKFFVVDERIVITGSMNPSSSGANYNDENILIIENDGIAKLFKEEFERLVK